ncbi:hypothetical protein D6777_01110 [Candidatus Woesearchaeota archaeon]|nr:MAG: hypothetical protein D6777_01110 [Candidatus Woesearchaeota archaeon]
MLALNYYDAFDFHQNLYLTETRIADEMFAMQNTILKYPAYTKRVLKKDYLKHYLSDLKAEQEIDWIKHIVSDKIKKGIMHAKLYFEYLPRNLANVIYLGFGPKSKEIKKLNFSSPIDDLVLWNEASENVKFVEKVKSIIKSKGYKIKND